MGFSRHFDPALAAKKAIRAPNQQVVLAQITIRKSLRAAD